MTPLPISDVVYAQTWEVFPQKTQSNHLKYLNVTRSKSNHEIFSHLTTTIILCCFDLYKNEFFFAGFGNIVPKYFKDVCFACYTHLSESQFKNNTDYSLVLVAFVGLALVSSIFCSMNNVLEQ